METTVEIRIPQLSLVVLIGPSGSGKSTFARKHFLPSEILSADQCRAMVSDDENNQTVTKEAFEILHFIAAKRLAAGKLTVVDATNVQVEARKPLVSLAREFHCLPVAIVFDLPERLCQDRNEQRPDRNFGRHVIRQQLAQLNRSGNGLKREGFRHIFRLRSQDEVDAVTLQREPLWNDRKVDHGPFDIIGDVHGCFAELQDLLGKLGYISVPAQRDGDQLATDSYQHPEGRKVIFLGDIVDRGPHILDTVKLVYSMVKSGNALCVPGNHDIKLMRKLRGNDVHVAHGMAESLAEIDAVPIESQNSVRRSVHDFIDSFVSHYVLDDGRLVVAHAGLKETMQGRGSGAVREFCLFGETTGETDEFGLPVRYNWATEYRGQAAVVYGHTPVVEPEWLNNTINIDTGCVFGGKLTALRYPENELVSVASRKTYCEPARPLKLPGRQSDLSAQQLNDEVLDLDDIFGKRIIDTGLRSTVTIREENASAALELISRYAVNPKWIIYVPPTMSPCETSSLDEYLEFPTEAFSHYRRDRIQSVVCQEKHMGSRAVVIICSDEEAAVKRFGVRGGEAGCIYTRTGRPFFQSKTLESEVLERLRTALDTVDFWSKYQTKWACFDCELMPWSMKAQELLKDQYAAVGTAARHVLGVSASMLESTASRDSEADRNGRRLGSSTDIEDPSALLQRMTERQVMVDRYITAYRNYCWPVGSVDDLKLAPFHLMATEGRVFTDSSHLQQMEILGEICSADASLLLSTKFRVVDLTDAQSEQDAVSWWRDLTETGGEGMVIKPLQFVSRGKRGLAQPALKCRGREYLRIIYGPEYTAQENLVRLRERHLGSKRSLALREFALGVEALDRFVQNQPLRRVHECVFGVLALECEPVDPRL